VAAVIVTVGTLSGCATDGAPQGYGLVGSFDGYSLFASPHPDQSRVDVILKDASGDVLCDASGPLLSSKASTSALCDGAAGDTYAYVLPVGRDSDVVRLCNTSTGSPVPAGRLAGTPDADLQFLVVVRPTRVSASGVGICAP
jgi:hypothetical protein